MSTYIDKLRGLRPGKGVSGGSPADQKSDLPLDHRLTFSPQKDEKWTFEEEQRICLNDADIKEIVGESGNDVRTLCGISQGLHEYQRHVWGKGGKGMGRFNGAVDSLQGTILGRLGSIYDGLTGGVRFECNGGDFWINNVNVHSVLKLYLLRPTDKARHYLSGIRDKLGLILSRQQSSTRYDGIQNRAKELFDDITLALEFVPSDAPPRLLDGSRRS
ncbi:MAG: hypothetical protein V2A66_05975 [Pseudomonadota bacterium]